jgi:hypothetical protein
MSTLHIFRSEPDEQVREIVRAITHDDQAEVSQIALYGEAVDYDQLVEALFSHDRVISWW